jgi:integrase
MSRRRFGSVRRLPSGRWQVRYRTSDGRQHTAPETFATKTEATRHLAQVETDLGRGQWSDPRLGRTHLRGVGCSLGGHHGQPAGQHPGDLPQPAAPLPAADLRPDAAGRPGRDGGPSLAGEAGTRRSRSEYAGQVLPAAVAHPGHGHRERLPDPQPVHHPRGRVRASPRDAVRHRGRGRGLADAIPPRFRALVLVAAYTGLRWGDLAGLRVRRVDLLHHRITVAEQLLEVRGQLAVGPPKTGAGQRMVTLPTVAAEALAEHLGVYAEAGPDGLVFSAERGGPIRRSNFTRRVWIPATRAAGVEGLRFHDLRHTAATLAVAAGASTRELMVRMGHSSSAAALRYQHVMAGRDAAIAAALDELVQAASARSEDPVAGGSGTRVARTGQHRRKGNRR